ncbi:phage holin family protein [Tardiphaga alba]|uniref:Phage holin family protein n=1 Tax=Tardiphaga alba TaxID=340268 RepID=A0ABX8AFU7_9BRAD|nr:phage holin family protein [Tardiphaga alba]QUS41260.1 phage holin family protein [Tardiphaga alba]
MSPLVSALARTGLALKLDQVKRATSSYMRDRSEQGTSIAVSYATAAGLYAAAGIFLIATLLVGAAALFRWVEIEYGLFPAFGVTGGLLLLLAATFAGLAAARLKKPSRQFPTLSSRLRVAVNATPSRQSSIPAQRTAQPAEFKPSTSPSRPRTPTNSDNGPLKAGLLLAATLAGWALTRRHQLAKDITPPRKQAKAEN